MRRFLPLGLCLLLACAGPATPEPKEAQDLVPGDNEISGWTRSGAMKLIETDAQLLNEINGEGQPYIDNGFNKAAFQSYSGLVGANTVVLDLRVFDMADTANARAVYPAVAGGTETPWTGSDAPGDEARVDESQLFAYRVDFRSDKFYVSLTIQEKSQPALDVAKLFAANIAAAVEDDSTGL